MYGLVSLVICVLVVQTTAYGHGRRPWCNHEHHNYRPMHANDEDFHTLSWDVVRLDSKARRVCQLNKNHTTETYFANSYKLSVPLPGFAEGDISVKLRHRVLFIQAYKANERKIFTELKILPAIVKNVDATWTFVDEVLDVNIPYKFTLGKDIVSTCEDNINEDVITVPQAGIDVRFGDDTSSAPTTPPNISNNVV